jgi:hypothetical protein
MAEPTLDLENATPLFWNQTEKQRQFEIIDAHLSAIVRLLDRQVTILNKLDELIGTLTKQSSKLDAARMAARLYKSK